MHVQSDDEVIVARCLAGDQAAFAFLVNKYKGAVHGYAYLKVHDYQDAQDIVQEVFIKAYKKLAQLKWPHRFQSWLYTIAANECKLWLRGNSKEREQEVPLEDVPVENLDELAVRNHSDEDIELTVRNAMETLPHNSQLALSLYYMSDLSTKEVAGFMGISPNNVGVILHRARKQLGERLEKMIGKQLKKEKLKAGFIFKVADSIRDMPIPSLSKPPFTKWTPIPISIGLALLIGIIGYGVSAGKDVSPDVPTLKPAAFAVSLLPDVDEQKALDMKNSDESQLVALYSGDDSAEEAGGSFDKNIVVRRVGFKENILGDHVYPSPDGRYLSFVNGKNGNLAIYDLTTGENRDLTDEGRWEAARRHAERPTWSPDSKQIAYVWVNEDTIELRIVGLDGSKPRVLRPSEESRGRIGRCHDWSRDGKYILTRLKEPQSIALIPVDGGPTRIIKSPAPSPNGMTISPDGRYIVYDRKMEEHEDLRDIFMLTTDGSGQETRLTEHPANDHGPIWSPDGKSIVFVSNRTPDGTLGLWLMQIVDGKPAGKPQMVKNEVGNMVSTLGFTEKGSLFYMTISWWSDIYVTSVDMETGKLLSTPELLPSQGFNTMPAWSPNGESLAYESRRTAPGSFRVRPALMIRSMKTGEERELIPDQDIGTWHLGQLRWSPDGRSILCGGDPVWKNLHLIDVQTGHVTTNVATRKGGYISGPAWSPDGKTIFYIHVRIEKEDWPCRIVALDLETRKERELHPGGSRESFLAVSPDGRQLAFRDKDGMIKVIPTEGGEPRTLLNMKDFLGETSYSSGPSAWTPDGRYVLFVTGPLDEQPDSMVQLWGISVEGGIPQKLLEERGMLQPIYHYSPSPHPDGRRIAFQKGNWHKDLWVMENLLPTSTASR
ncbi:sigma-70 family RNA polymerase sigma factor [Candidatus Poribacteria bacterium]